MKGVPSFREMETPSNTSLLLESNDMTAALQDFMSVFFFTFNVAYDLDNFILFCCWNIMCLASLGQSNSS